MMFLFTAWLTRAYEREHFWVNHYRQGGKLLNGPNCVMKVYNNPIGLMVTDDMLAQMDAHARCSGRSRSDVAREAIDYWLAEAHAKAKEKQK